MLSHPRFSQAFRSLVPSRARAPAWLALGLATACSGSGFTPTDAGSPGLSDDGGATGAGDADAATLRDAATDALGDASTVADPCGYSYSGYNASASVKATSTVAWTCTATTRTVTANGIPDHDVGTFPNANCPNTIAAQSVSATMTLDPVSTGTATAIQVVGYALNGVKLDPGTAGTCTVEADGGDSCTLAMGTGAWNIEALGQSSFDFGVDSSHAHVQPGGAYHYHGVPEGLLARLSNGNASARTPTLVGFALDGFPVYARYGYSRPMDSTSAVKIMTGSYQLKTTPDSGRPPVATYPMGAFRQDYTYVAGSGDLDECNGRTDVTPEYPKGTYHYYVTDTYPFIQRCVKGTASTSGGGAVGGAGGGPGGGPPGGGPPGGGPPGSGDGG